MTESMDKQREVEFGASKRRVPMWVWDSLAALLLLVVWVVTTRADIADALTEGREPSVSFGIPAIVLLYGAYRVGRRLIKGSAYPPKRDRARSFRLSR